MTFAATVFALKLGLTLGGGVSGWVLDGVGYVPKSAIQTTEAIEGIRAMMSFGPALAFMGAALVLVFYAIGRKEEVEMGIDLAQRRGR